MSRLDPQNVWDIGLAAWIIQDGNYPDFAVGQTAEFAVEFFQVPDAVTEACDSDVSTKSLGGAVYDVVAEKVMQTDKITVLDVGLLVYSQFPCEVVPACPRRFHTQLHLGVDPFHQFEFLDEAHGVRPLVYSWRVASILRQTAPFVEVAPRVRARDASKLAYEEISRTDAWTDDAGHGEYVLRCELLPIAPKSTSVTAFACPD